MNRSKKYGPSNEIENILEPLAWGSIPDSGPVRKAVEHDADLCLMHTDQVICELCIGMCEQHEL